MMTLIGFILDIMIIVAIALAIIVVPAGIIIYFTYAGCEKIWGKLTKCDEDDFITAEEEDYGSRN